MDGIFVVVLEESLSVFRSLRCRADVEVAFWEGGLFMGGLLLLLLLSVFVSGGHVFMGDSLSLLLLTSSGCADAALFFLDDRFVVDIWDELFDR